MTSPPLRSARRTVRAGCTAPRALGRRRRAGRIGVGGHEQREQPAQVLALGDAQLGDVPVPQHLVGAGAGGQVGGLAVVVPLAGAGVERRGRGQLRRLRWPTSGSARGASPAKYAAKAAS